MSSGVTQNQSSPGIFENPADGAPKAVAPKESDYEAPGTEALQNQINTDQAAAPITVDDTQFQQQRAQENDALAHLQGIASGAIKTDAQAQGEQQLQAAQAQAQGSTEAIRGVNPALAVREQQQAQATADMQARAKIAQTAVQQQSVARTQAASLVSNMAREAQAQSELHLNADRANAQHESQILGERMNLAAMRQQSSIAFSAAQNAYQTQQRQEAIANNAKHQEGVTRQIVGGLEVVGGAAAILFGTLGGAAATVATFGGAAPLGVALGAASITGGVGLAGKGAADFASGTQEAQSNPGGQ